MIKATEARKQIASGQTAPLYLLEGDDQQSRHDLALEFAAVVDEGLQAFNVESFYANESTSQSARDVLMGTLLSTARTLPMMSPRRVIIVHEADRLLSPKRGRDDDDGQADLDLGPKKKRAITPSEELEAYFEKPEPMTTLVFVSGPLDGNRRLVKLLRKRAVTVDCGSLESAQEAALWIKKRLEKDELGIDPKALALLLETTGLSLGRIRAEVEKLVLYAAGESAITAAHVRDLVMPELEPGEGPAVGLAVKDWNPKKALDEISALMDNGIVAPAILGQIRWGVTQRRQRVVESLELVLRTDIALKSSGGEPRYLLERLVIELCGR